LEYWSMNIKFLQLIESLEPKFQNLINMAPLKYGSLPKNLPKRAIYLCSQKGEHLYVGRTNDLRARLRGHCSSASKHFSATFAFRIARQNSTGITLPLSKAHCQKGKLIYSLPNYERSASVARNAMLPEIQQNKQWLEDRNDYFRDRSRGRLVPSRQNSAPMPGRWLGHDS
jgi:hypothetical protein